MCFSQSHQVIQQKNWIRTQTPAQTSPAVSFPSYPAQQAGLLKIKNTKKIEHRIKQEVTLQCILK